MGRELLVEQIEAGKEFVREFGSYIAVTVAFWINPAESDEWYLYIASDEIDDSSIGKHYREVLRRLKLNQWLDPFRVKLVSSADPVSGAAIDIRNRHAGKFVTHYNGSSIGGVGIESACIYPPLSAVKTIKTVS